MPLHTPGLFRPEVAWFAPLLKASGVQADNPRLALLHNSRWIVQSIPNGLRQQGRPARHIANNTGLSSVAMVSSMVHVAEGGAA